MLECFMATFYFTPVYEIVTNAVVLFYHVDVNSTEKSCKM